MKTFTAVAALAVASAAAQGAIRITEWMYDGANGEFIELTNLSDSPIDMTGWSFDDDSRTPGAFPLGGFGIVQPGESVVFTEATAEFFRTAWSLAPTVKVVGGLGAGPFAGTNIGRNDELNIFNASGDLIDRLTYGDQNIPGTIRTQNTSGNPATLVAIGANDVSQWVFSAVGDVYGSYQAGLSLGNPGRFVIPAPGSGAVVMLALAVGARRRAR